MTTEEVWSICAQYVDNAPANRTAKALGTCAASVVFEQGLLLDSDGDPHPKHANIVGWPTQKHAWKILQQKIAEKMTLHLRAQ